MHKKRYFMIAVICALSLCAVSCGNAMEPDNTVNAAAKETQLFSDRDLSGAPPKGHRLSRNHS